MLLRVSTAIVFALSLSVPYAQKFKLKDKLNQLKGNSSAPNLDDWKSGLDELVGSNDCDGLIEYSWTVETKVEINPDDFETADDGEYIPPNKTPNMGVFHLNDAPQSDFEDYWIKTGVALAKCGEFKHLLLHYDDLDYTADYRDGKPNQPNHIMRKGTEDHIVKKLWASIKSEVGAENVFDAFTELLKDSSIPKEEKQECADQIMLLYKWDYEWYETKHASSLFPYFNPFSQDWIIYMAQCEFDSKKVAPELVKSLESNNYKTRVLAMNHLGNYKYLPAKDKIAALAESDSYYETKDGVKVYPVREAATEALGKLK